MKIITAASLIVMFPGMALAQSGFFFVPSVTVSLVRDDNIFFTADGEVSDQLTRVSPALQTGYDSQRLNWEARVFQDLEKYQDNTQLDSNQIRRVAEINGNYLASPRMTLNGRVNYLKTETPADIDIISGFPQGRFDAENYIVEPSVRYRFSAANTGSLLYRYEDISIPALASSNSHTAGLRFERSLSSENLFTAGYNYRRYQFDGVERSESHTPWIGFTHRFSANNRVETEIGPRFGDGGTDAYLLLAMIRDYEQGSIELSFTIDESNSIGDIGIIENRTAGLSVVHQQGENISLSMSGYVGKAIYSGLSSDVAQANAQISYRVMDALFLTAAYAYNEQRAGFLETAEREISRSTFAVGFRLLWPSRARSQNSRNTAS
jgi:hypothetical protein